MNIIGYIDPYVTHVDQKWQQQLQRMTMIQNAQSPHISSQWEMN